MTAEADKKHKMQAIGQEATALIKKHGLNFLIPVMSKGIFYFRGNEAVGVVSSMALPKGKMQVQPVDKVKEPKCPYEFYLVLGKGPKSKLPPMIINPASLN